MGGGVGSNWWRDLGKLEGYYTNKVGWLSNGITNKLGNGDSISFWSDQCMGQVL